MNFHILTLFPEAFQGWLGHSILGRAAQRGLVAVTLTNIRDYAHDAHATADDYQFGGGAGMIMKPEPIFEAAEAALSGYPEAERPRIPVILLSPQGQVFHQRMAERLAQAPALVFICGHYSGVDERVREHLATHDISIGDYVLTGGELPAMVIADAVARYIPGVVGTADNVAEDSITSGLLQHPVYTRPPEHRGWGVPEILRGGHHAKIVQWRREQALRRTFAKRPDLLASAPLTPADLKFLRSLGYVPNDYQNPET